MTLCVVLGGLVVGPNGIELYETYPAVREVCAQISEWTGVEFPAVLAEDFTDRPDRRTDAEIRQVALSLGVVDVLSAMGVRAGAVGGVSLGEMIGATLVGSLERRELCEILNYRRLKVPAASPDGRALAFAGLALPAGEDVDFYVGPRRPGVHLGADNFGTLTDGSRVLTISGYLDDLVALADEVAASPGRAGQIDIYQGWGAPHCPLNEYVRDIMRPHLDSIEFRDPRLPLFSGRRPGQVLTANAVRADFVEDYTSYVSVTHLYTALERFGVTLGIFPVSGPTPEASGFPFPRVEIQLPEDIEEARSASYALGVDFG